ncbi:PrgI family protein [Candidatus Gottesmanbacteria bacterium]|nr:PrgI family protein [Candidatus Gottesmanbacteria bacterium]
MEQHPVPQNVTTFQFRLIGDMTIKQFGYLAGGLILGYIAYKLPLPFFFTWPLALFFGLGGFGFAFVPVEERPMDVWVLSFLKNVYSPTQYLWQKSPFAKASEDKQKPPTAANLMDILSQRTAARKTTAVIPPVRPGSRTMLISEIVTQPFGWLRTLAQTITSSKKSTPIKSGPTPPDLFTPAKEASITGARLDLSTPQAAQPVPPAPSPQVLEEKAALERRLDSLQQELATKTATDARLKDLQAQIAQAIAEKAKMEQELTSLRQQLESHKPATAASRPASVAQPLSPSPTVRIVPPDMATKMGLPRLTTFPNVITGILKDTSSNLLPGVLVTVRDKDDIPVRALKTNKLGQFAASTPLPNGTYTIDIEDPREQFLFDRIQITLTGEIMPAVEVTAKNQKQVAREKLAAEIFGSTKM